MMFAIACFLAYFWATYCVPETANVSLEEIDAVFKSSAGVEDVALKRQVCYFLAIHLWVLMFRFCLRSRWSLGCVIWCGSWVLFDLGWIKHMGCVTMIRGLCVTYLSFEIFELFPDLI